MHAAIPETLPVCIVTAGLSADLAKCFHHRFPDVLVYNAATTDLLLAELERTLPSLLVIDGEKVQETIAILGQLRQDKKFAQLPVFCCLSSAATRQEQQKLVRFLGVKQLFFHPVDWDELSSEASTLLSLPAATLPVLSEKDQGMEADIAALWEKFRPVNMARLQVLEDAAAALLKGNLSSELRIQAEREAHKLAGSSGSFGYMEVSRIARQLELLLQGKATIEQPDLLRMSRSVVSLRERIQRPLANSLSNVPGQKQPFLLIVDSDDNVAQPLLLECAARGIQATVATSESDIQETMARRMPDVVLLDPELSDGLKGSGPNLLAELATREIPVLIYTKQDKFEDRVQATRLGARGFLRKPMTSSEVVQAVQELLQRLRQDDYKVICVDDDPEILSSLRELLENKGVRLTTVNDPLAFWDALESSLPDLIILDLNMPHLTGVELCRVVRSEPRWSELPILFLTSNTDSATVQRIFAAGADDYITKPLLGPELVARVFNRLERTRLQRQMAEKDPLTGAGNRRKYNQVMNHYIHLAERNKQPLSLAILDLDRLKQINDAHGHAIGDAALRRLGVMMVNTFRSEDVVARWGGDEFVIGMYGMRRDDAAQRLRALLDSLQRERFQVPDGPRIEITFSAGIAQYPDDGLTAHALYLIADRALYAAKAAGKSQVHSAARKSKPAQEHGDWDVVLVEDDAALAGTLLHALETRGHKAHWMKSGATASKGLTGEKPSLKAKLVLLDADSPGIDGYSILRKMVRDGVRSRVIMMSVHSREDQVMAALEAGAYDHIAKPFSVPILMHRIKRALES
ncbi:MAG: Two component response regulator receiver modulated diguanylate cyclase [Candidatus Angelobacter sp.]|nr:Two component response regulator receiver modulated diguanylate cyclase [Candidatus Angelobacter sp.]